MAPLNCPSKCSKICFSCSLAPRSRTLDLPANTGETWGHGIFFRRTYFAPQQEILDLFAKITSDKAFASNVKELIYDARLFWRRFEDPAVFKRAYLKSFPDRLFVDHRTLTGEDSDGYEGDVDDPFGAADHSSEQQHAIIITSD